MDLVSEANPSVVTEGTDPGLAEVLVEIRHDPLLHMLQELVEKSLVVTVERCETRWREFLGKCVYVIDIQ